MIYNSFFAKTSDTYKYIKDKKPQLHFDYDEIMHETHNRVFTIAKMTNIDLLNDVKNSLENAYKNGVNFEDWKKQIKPKLKAKGWFGKTEVVKRETGEVKEIYVGSRRLKTIYNTNMRTNYAKSRYESQMQANAELFRYTAVMDNLTRASHRSMHNLVLPKTDPFWDTNYPPNGWNCRCKVQAITISEAKRRGYKVRVDSSGVNGIADKDFAYNPGKTDKIDEILAKKKDRFKLNTKLTSKEVNAILKDLGNFTKQRELYVWKKGLNDMVDNIAKGNIIKDKMYQIAQVGKIIPNIKNKLKEIDINPKASSISIYQNTISHILRDTKPSKKEPSIAEIKSIVDVFIKAKHCFYDKKNKNLIYFYPSLQKDDMVNSAVVNLDYILKKFKTDNFIATISKIPMINYMGVLRDKKRYIRLK